MGLFFGFLLGNSFHGITAFLMEGWIIVNIMSKYVGGGGEGVSMMNTPIHLQHNDVSKKTFKVYISELWQ